MRRTFEATCPSAVISGVQHARLARGRDLSVRGDL